VQASSIALKALHGKLDRSTLAGPESVCGDRMVGGSSQRTSRHDHERCHYPVDRLQRYTPDAATYSKCKSEGACREVREAAERVTFARDELRAFARDVGERAEAVARANPGRRRVRAARDVPLR
jgi:hypothetical protein